MNPDTPSPRPPAASSEPSVTVDVGGAPDGRAMRSGNAPANAIWAGIHRPEAGAIIGTLVVFAFFAVAGGSTFVSEGGTASWANVAAELGIVAVPVALLMIAGELDLSVGSVIAASSMLVAIIHAHYELPIVFGILAGLAVGLLAGFVNGIVVTTTKLPSFIVTLGTSFALAGLALGFSRLLTGSTSISLYPPNWAHQLFAAQWHGQFNAAILWWLGIAAVAMWILNVTRSGNWIQALGGDIETARAMGVQTGRVKVALFMASGLGAALVGVIQSIEFGGAQVTTGQAYVFNSIIAVVIGGVLLTGGYGSIVGVVFGTLTFAIVNQGVFYTGWDSSWAQLILGGLLLGAVLANNTFRRMALSRITGRQGKR